MKLTPKERIEMALNKYGLWTDDELYILKRAFVESAFNIQYERKYSEDEREMHNKLMNEIIDEIKRRDELVERLRKGLKENKNGENIN